MLDSHMVIDVSQSAHYLLKILAFSVIFLKLSGFAIFIVDKAQRKYDCLRIWAGGTVASQLKTWFDLSLNQAYL